MTDTCWTITPCRGDAGDAYQAHALGRVPGYPSLTETRALGPQRPVAALGDDGARRAAEADAWASNLPPAPGYAPLTARPAPPRLVVSAVPEPVLVPAPLPPEPEPDDEAEPEDADEPASAPRPRPKPLARRASPRKGR